MMDNKLRRHSGVVLSEALWTELEELCERSNLSITQGVSIAICDLLNRHGKDGELTMPRELIVAFHDASVARRKEREAVTGKTIRKYARAK